MNRTTMHGSVSATELYMFAQNKELASVQYWLLRLAFNLKQFFSIWELALIGIWNLVCESMYFRVFINWGPRPRAFIWTTSTAVCSTYLVIKFGVNFSGHNVALIVAVTCLWTVLDGGALQRAGFAGTHIQTSVPSSSRKRRSGSLHFCNATETHKPPWMRAAVH